MRMYMPTNSNRWEARSWFRSKISVGNLPSPSPNCLPFLQNGRLQFSTPWPWGIMRSHRHGEVKDNVQAMRLSDILISAATFGHLPASSGLTSPTNRLLVPGTWNRAPLSIKHPGAYMGTYSQLRLRVSCLWRVWWRVCTGVYWRASLEITLEHIVKQDGSVASSAIGSVFECVLGSVLESVWRAYLEAYS
jgi:hypothetical protein